MSWVLELLFVVKVYFMGVLSKWLKSVKSITIRID